MSVRPYPKKGETMKKAGMIAGLLISILLSGARLYPQESARPLRLLPPDTSIFIRFNGSKELSPKLDSIFEKIALSKGGHLDERFIAGILKKKSEGPLPGVDRSRSWVLALLDMEAFENAGVLIVPVSDYDRFLNFIKNNPDDAVISSDDYDIIEKGNVKFYVKEHQGYAFVCKYAGAGGVPSIEGLGQEGKSLLEVLKADFSSGEVDGILKDDISLFINLPSVMPFISAQLGKARSQMKKLLENPQIPEFQKKSFKMNIEYMSAMEKALLELDSFALSTTVLPDASILFKGSLKIKEGGTISAMTKGHPQAAGRTLSFLPDGPLFAMGANLNPSALKDFYAGYFKWLASISGEVDEEALDKLMASVNNFLGRITGDMAWSVSESNGSFAIYEIIEHTQGTDARGLMLDYIAQFQSGAFKEMMQGTGFDFDIAYRQNLETNEGVSIDAIDYTFSFGPEMKQQAAILKTFMPEGKMTIYVAYLDNLTLVASGKDTANIKTLIADVRNKASMLLKNPKIADAQKYVDNKASALTILSLSESAVSLSRFLGRAMKQNCLASQKQVEEAAARYRAATGGYPANIFVLYREKYLLPPAGMCPLGVLTIDSDTGKVFCSSCGTAEAPSESEPSFPVPSMKLEKTGYIIKSVIIKPDSISTKAYLPIDEIVAMKEIVKRTRQALQQRQVEMQKAMKGESPQ